METMLSSGTTLLFVSHNIEDVKRLCDHALWLDHGNMVMMGEAAEVCEAYMSQQ